MNNTFSLEQIFQTGKLDSNLILRQCKFNLMAMFMKIKSINPKLKRSGIAKDIGCSTKTLH